MLQITTSLAAENNTHLPSHSVCGSGVWAWGSWSAAVGLIWLGEPDDPGVRWAPISSEAQVPFQAHWLLAVFSSLGLEN